MLKHKPAPATAPIHELIAGRWSPRAYSDEPVSHAALHAMLEAARWAPSASNQQPWRFMVFNRADDQAAFNRAFATLRPLNQQWNAPVPVLIAVTTQTLNAKGEVNRTAQYDAGAAAMSLALQAHALGLAAHQMGGFDASAFRKEFALPEGVEPLVMISIGHFGDAEKLDPALLEREKATRARMALGEIAYANAWKQPFRG
jgi:nitroreductase